MKNIILTLDLGNTALAAGLWDAGCLVENWSAPFTVRGLEARLRKILARQLIDSAILASVVPDRNDSLRKTCRRLGIACSLLTPATATGLKILYSNPKQVGADRLANAIAAFHRYGGPAIVIDFGTAITFDVISGKFEYLGGVIAPGLRISTEALFKKAALLPKVRIDLPKGVLGRETSEAIRSGVYWGTLGLVERIIRELKRELGWGRETRADRHRGPRPPDPFPLPPDPEDRPPSHPLWALPGRRRTFASPELVPPLPNRNPLLPGKMETR